MWVGLGLGAGGRAESPMGQEHGARGLATAWLEHRPGPSSVTVSTLITVWIGRASFGRL